MNGSKRYTVTCLDRHTDPDRVNWDNVPVADISEYRWLDGGYEPQTAAQLVFIPDSGFVLKMTCRESDPKAVYHAYMDPVYTDSCLEFFARYVNGDDRYINMEMNANGALLSAIGASREGRVPVADITGGSVPRVKPLETGSADTWGVIGYIPLDFLKAAYGADVSVIKSGYTFYGNFYKCGDDTQVPHYGMWNPVDLPKPDFHRPEFFGTLVIR